MGMNKHICFS